MDDPSTPTRWTCLLVCLLLLGLCAALGCRSNRLEDLGQIYSRSAQAAADDRVPVVVIPGILGSKLEDGKTMQKVWGAFTFGAADADTPEGARSIALPMAQGVPLAELQDGVIPTDVLDVLIADIAVFRGLELEAYAEILSTLAVGGYRDQSLGRSGAIDYGDGHFTCYQYPYDWRRDIAENARALHAFIKEVQATVRDAQNLPADAPVKVDIVAHSMGGLVLRYYLRYGPNPLPPEGDLPEVTWAGAKNIRKAVLIGTPNAGSVRAFQQLLQGMNLNPLFPNYRPPVLGTMPAVYQLLPRNRHAKVRWQQTGEPIDLYDPAVWEAQRWGLMDPRFERTLGWLLPGVDRPELRRQIAREHLAKCLTQAQRLHAAMDQDAGPVPGVDLVLFLGDADRNTPDAVLVGSNGRIAKTEYTFGDGTVTRQSALLDERSPDAWQARLDSPVHWSRVQFLTAEHLALTKAPAFIDNLLYLLLEDPSD